jgi:hypothetical protein
MIPHNFPYLYSKNIEFFDEANADIARKYVLDKTRSLVSINVPVAVKRGFVTAISIFSWTAGPKFDQLPNSKIVLHLEVDGITQNSFMKIHPIESLFDGSINWITPIKVKAQQTVNLKIDNALLLDSPIGARIWGFWDFQIDY